MGRLIGWLINPISGVSTRHMPVGLNQQQQILVGEYALSPQEFVQLLSQTHQEVLFTPFNLPLRDPEYYDNAYVNALKGNDQQQEQADRQWWDWLKGQTDSVPEGINA